jgi:RHS repeat-associated protein
MPRTPLLAGAVLATALLVACDLGSGSYRSLASATPGLPRFQAATAIAVPGGIVNAAGGNLLLRRVDLAIDTRLGALEIGAVYNSKTRRWLWSWELRYTPASFVDGSGAVYLFPGDLPDGTRIPGAVWVKLDASRIGSVGGLVYEFASDGRLAALRWESGAFPRLEYLAQTIAGEPRTSEIRQCGAPGSCAPVASIDRDAEGRVVRVSDRAGRAAEFGYDESGWLVVARDALDVERGLPGFRYEYGDDQRLLARTSSEGERIEYGWHWKQGRITFVRAMGGEPAVHRFEYARDGHATAPHTTEHTDPLGNRTLYRYEGSRRLREVTLPTGEQVAREWSGFEVSRLVEPGGFETLWSYLGSSEVIRTDPSGNEVHFRFRVGSGEDRTDPFRHPIERIDDSLGAVERRGYDAQGRLAWIENGAGERTSYAWNAANLLAGETRPDGIAIAYSDHGEHGHPETVAVAGEIAARTFDAVGNLVSTSGLERLDPRPGGEIARSYDGDRNLSEIALVDLPASGEPTQATLRIEWRSDGQMLRIERPGGGDHEFDYDAQGHLVARRERSGGTWATTLFEVDPLGRTVAETLPNGMRREFGFDAAGRSTGLRALRHGALEGELALAWSSGRVASADDSSAGGIETYTWDAAGELAAVEFPGGERLEIEHDLRGRRVLERYRLADGALLREIGFAHDGADREIRIREDGATLVERSFAAGRLASTGFGNGLVRANSYDPATGLLASSTSLAPGGALVESSAISFAVVGAAGEVRLAAETASAGPAAASTREEFALGSLAGEGKRLLAAGDGAGELLHAADPLANATLAGESAFLYDAEATRLVARVDAASGALLADYTWDAAGFCTGRGGVALAWTALGQIASIGADALFEWDLQGRPLGRTLAGQEVRFLFGGRVEADALGAPIRLDLGAVAIRLDTGEHRYRHLDFRGNVKLESDDAGAIAQHLRYGPYGIDAAFGAGDGAATFAGGRDLGELVLIGARPLDSTAGRFLSPDPVLQLLNQYSYTLANPVLFWDPDGRRWRLAGFFYGASATAGGAIISSGLTAALGSSVLAAGVGSVVGGPIGAVFGIAFAQMIHQQLVPGERGLFRVEDVLKLATPLYVDPPARDAEEDRQAPAPGQGQRLQMPATSPGCECSAAPPAFNGSSFRFSAFGVGGISGAVGGGFGGF